LRRDELIDESMVRLERGESLSPEAVQVFLTALMEGGIADEVARAWLAGLHRRGETVEELIAAASVLRSRMTAVPATLRPVTDTCGTGGTGTGLFNVSTASAIVAAAAGVRIAKHGNRRVTGQSGSADVLQELGVNVEQTPEAVAWSIDNLGIGFCFAPLFHPAMRSVAALRRSIAHPTLFNWLGPLCNPARAERQVLGVGRVELLQRVPGVLKGLGVERFAVLRSEDGLCEISSESDTEVHFWLDGKEGSLRWSPSDFGSKRQPWKSLVVDGPEASAAVIRGVLAGEPGVAREIVVANAAAAVWLDSPSEGVLVAAEKVRAAIDSGAARQLLEKWRVSSQR